MLRGVKKLDFKFTLTMAAYDLIKLPRLIAAGLRTHASPLRMAAHTTRRNQGTTAIGLLFSSMLGPRR